MCLKDTHHITSTQNLSNHKVRPQAALQGQKAKQIRFIHDCLMGPVEDLNSSLQSKLAHAGGCTVLVPFLSPFCLWLCCILDMNMYFFCFCWCWFLITEWEMRWDNTENGEALVVWFLCELMYALGARRLIPWCKTCDMCGVDKATHKWKQWNMYLYVSVYPPHKRPSMGSLLIFHVHVTIDIFDLVHGPFHIDWSARAARSCRRASRVP